MRGWLMKLKDKTPRSFGTHSGSFHADEVTACALLLLFDLIDRDRIVRTRDPLRLDQCEFVCDVGGIYDPAIKRFDHHQIEYQGLLSSAGMVLLYLKNQKILSETYYEYFNRALIHGVDLQDNGEAPQVYGWSSFSDVIANFNTIEHGLPPEEQDRCFFRALDFVKEYLDRLYKRFQYLLSCRDLVERAMEENSVCLRFEKSVPWLELFFECGGESHPAQFLIMPSGTHWKLRAIPPSYEDRMNVRTPLPKEWAGLHEEDLKKASGIEGAIFCHKGRFISVWETREGAEKALDYILKGDDCG